MLGSAGILSSHQILNFAFPHIWPFTDQALLLCDFIYIRPWNQLSLFYHDLVCSDSDLSFLQQSLPYGLQVVMVALLRFMAGIIDRKCMLFLIFLLPNTWFLFSQL